MMRTIIFLLLTFCIISVNAQNRRLKLQVGLTNNIGLHIHSVSGYQSIAKAKGKLFPLVGLSYVRTKKNGAVNTFYTTTHSTGHEWSLKEELFDKANRFTNKATYHSLALGYRREWPMLKKILASSNTVFLGVGTDLNLRILHNYPYSSDTVSSKNGDVFISVPRRGGIYINEKAMINGNIGLRYQINQKSIERLSLSFQYHWAISKTYDVSYSYNFQNLSDFFILTNRGHLLNFLMSIPLGKRK